MAPAIIRALFTAKSEPSLEPVKAGGDIAALGPLAARTVLLGRDDGGEAVLEHANPSLGGLDPHDINNTAIFVLFGIIGAGFVVAGVWFFFWARNGGFHFREEDWDDYKSTVLRRKGPNGTTLSGATESTDLGGGSVYKDVADDDGRTADGRTVVSGTTGLTGITGGVSDVTGREKRRRKREQKEREKERRREEKARDKEERRRAAKSKPAGPRRVGRDGALIDEAAEAEAKEQLRNYRHERSARVGGINRASDGSAWGTSTNPSHSTAASSGESESVAGGAGAYTTTEADTGSTVTSDLMGNRQHTPTTTPTKAGGSGGIRKVYSTADKTASREAERFRAEARRLQDKGREVMALRESPPPARRDFSWDPSEAPGNLRSIEEGGSDGKLLEPASRVPGSWADSDLGSGTGAGTEGEAGTRVYRHSVHVPGTATSDFAYTEEKRKKRNGAGHRRRERAGESSR